MKASTSRLPSYIILATVCTGLICACEQKPPAGRAESATDDRTGGEKETDANRARKSSSGESQKPVVTSSTTWSGHTDANPNERVPLSGVPMRVGKFERADLNEDRSIDGKDLAVMRNSLESVVGQSRYDPRADLNGDGRIDCTDFHIWIQMVGPKKRRLLDPKLPCSERIPIR
jgi:Dockerin type I domain